MSNDLMSKAFLLSPLLSLGIWILDLICHLDFDIHTEIGLINSEYL